MFCIRTRPHRTPLIYREDLSTSSILHNDLHILMRYGDARAFPFRGFARLDIVRPMRTQFVKILYVEAFAPDGELSGFVLIPLMSGLLIFH
ncbi:hypothetical protein ACOMICROBIO_GDFFDHBD_00103 [Vibrio sp. B1REV9]|nr:hypothetical protein ACOMICROBIO_GDFFDHBD_00103 [Vibrio sp. B1REV9]